VMDFLFAFAPQGGDGGGGTGFMSTIIMFALIFLIFYFMILRPQQKRQKERTAMLGNLKKGDKIMTNGGIYGKIINVDEKTILLEIADNVKIKIDRSAVGSVVKEASGE